MLTMEHEQESEFDRLKNIPQTENNDWERFFPILSLFQPYAHKYVGKCHDRLRRNMGGV